VAENTLATSVILCGEGIFCQGTGRGKQALDIYHIFVMEPHHRLARVWYMLWNDLAVYQHTHAYIH